MMRNSDYCSTPSGSPPVVVRPGQAGFRGLIVAIGISSFGCSSATHEVGGHVSFDSQAVQMGRIAFRPEERDLHTLQANIVNGEFSFSGIPPGNYSVVITVRRKTGKRLPPEEGSEEVAEAYEQYIPAKYNVQSELHQVIAQDENDLVFDLSP